MSGGVVLCCVCAGITSAVMFLACRFFNTGMLVHDQHYLFPSTSRVRVILVFF